MSKIIVIGNEGGNANVALALLNENINCAKGPGMTALGELMFKTGEKCGVDFIAKLSADPLGKLLLAGIAALGGSIYNSPKGTFMAAAMYNNAILELDKKLGGKVDSALAEFMGKATKPAQDAKAEASMAAAEAFALLNADGDKNTRFSQTIGETDGKEVPASAINAKATDAESVYWPTKQDELKSIPQGQPGAGRSICPNCGKAHKRKSFSLYKLDANKPEVLLCTDCRTKLVNEAKAAEKIKGEESKYHENKAQIAVIEAELADAEREAKNVEKMAGDKPSPLMAAALEAANGMVKELDDRLMALYEETQGFEQKAGLSQPKSKADDKGGKPGVMDKLAQAGKSGDKK